MRPRIRGFQGPYSPEQKTTWVAQPIATACFYTFAFLFLDGDRLTWVVASYSACFAVLLGTWYACESMDPSTEGGLHCLPMRESQKKARYCAACRKSVPGMDHHCAWLNTCIGKRTYVHFYFLSMSGAAAATIESAVFVLLLTSWIDEAAAEEKFGSVTGYKAVLGTFTALVMILAFAFVSLWLFHTYLLTQGIGTYGWLVRKRERAQAAKTRARVQAAEKEKAKKKQRDNEEKERKENKQSGNVENGHGIAMTVT